MKVWFEDLPLFKPPEGFEFGEKVVAEGVIDIQRRKMKDREILLSLEDFVGGFKREYGWSNLSNIESTLAHLNGCKVRVTIDVLELPDYNSSTSTKMEMEE